MKKARQLLCDRIDGSKIRAFLQIAAMACQRQVRRIVVPLVLPSHNMLHMMGKLTIILMDAAILAAVERPSANELSCCQANQVSFRR